MDVLSASIKSEDALIVVDVGATFVKSALVARDQVSRWREMTQTRAQPWHIGRLCDLVARLDTYGSKQGLRTRGVCIAVPGRVDEYHGAVQFSPHLSWSDVGVADAVSAYVEAPVVVRNDVRVGAFAQGRLGGGHTCEGTLYVSIGTDIAAAGIQQGIVVPDHSGAGEIGKIRIRSGPGAGQTLNAYASAPGIRSRYARQAGLDIDSVAPSDVTSRLITDAVAQQVWDEALDAIAEGLQFATLLFGPTHIVVGGGLACAVDDFAPQLTERFAPRFAKRNAPTIATARFGADSTLVGSLFCAGKCAKLSDDAMSPAIEMLCSADVTE